MEECLDYLPVRIDSMSQCHQPEEAGSGHIICSLDLLRPCDVLVVDLLMRVGAD